MIPVAPITEQVSNKIRFRVDDVEPDTRRFPKKNAKLQSSTYRGKPLLAFSNDNESSLITTCWSNNCQFHPLVQTVHLAFGVHFPLRLTPDIIWITIAQGFAQHINNNSEKLRHHFVNHQGKKNLVVDAFQIPTLPQQWNEIIQQWTLQIRDQVGADVHCLLESNFSTTTPVSHTVSHIVMMDAFQEYFDYKVRCICGIPEITLEGTVEDWTSIYQRVQSMGKYDLEWWTDKLLPICQEFINTASGQPNLKFWQAIYKPKEVYGASEITGWLGVLFPYLKSGITELASRKNPMLQMNHHQFLIRNGISADSYLFSKMTHQGQIAEIYMLALLNLLKEGKDIGILLLWLVFLEKTYFPDKFRIADTSIPSGLSQVPCKLEMNQKNYSFALVGGFTGISQSDDGTLKPELGWGVIEKEDDPFAELLDKIEQEHITEKSIDWNSYSWNDWGGFIPKEIFQMLDRFNGATLYANSNHSWQISKYHEFNKSYKICPNLFSELDNESYHHNIYGNHFINLEDGRCIVYSQLGNKWYFVLGKPGKKIKTKLQELKELEELKLEELKELDREKYEAEKAYLEEEYLVIADDVKRLERVSVNLEHLRFQLEDAKIIADSISQLFERIFAADGQYYFDAPDFIHNFPESQ